MKPYNEQEYNKLCAEFLGGKIKEDGWNFCLTDFGVKYCGYGFHEGFELKFHSDWNWIMEVVEKIEKRQFDVHIASNSCTIHHSLNVEPVFETYIKETKKAAIQAIWEFLNWYKEQKQ